MTQAGNASIIVYVSLLSDLLVSNRICGERGIKAIMADFQSVKLKGKGHEKSDLEIILSKMEHWAHRFFPKLPFDDCVDSVAKLGNTKLVQVLFF